MLQETNKYRVFGTWGGREEGVIICGFGVSKDFMEEVEFDEFAGQVGFCQYMLRRECGYFLVERIVLVSID